MAKIAQGQLTIVDLHDMPPIQARLSSNKAKIFIQGKDGKIEPTLSPTNSLIVDAEVYQAGSSVNITQNPNPELGIISDIQWTFVTKDKTYVWSIAADKTALQALGVEVVSPGGVANRQVKITKNDILNPTLKIQAVAVYRYSGMLESTNVGMDIDFATIYSGVDGQDAFTVFLTNTSHIFPVDSSSGNIIPGVNVETVAEAYEGIKKLTGVKIAKNPSFTDTRFQITTPGNADKAVITTANGFRTYGLAETDQGTIPFEVTVPGVTTKFNQSFSWSVSSRGVDGQSATSYWLDVSDAVILKSFNSSGAPTLAPTSIKLKAMKQIGNGTPSDWTSSATIRVYKNGSSTASTVTGGSYAVASDTTSLKFELVLGSIVIDTETVRVVQQQKEPVVMAVQADSDTIRNGQGTITLKAVVYKNGSDFTSQASKKWYKSGTVIQNQTGSTLTVTSADIAASELYRCEATVEGAVYSDSITVWDVTDPIVIELRSSGGDKFQNGKGTSILECILWRNGAEIDSTGTAYTYTWKKLNAEGKEEAFTPVKEPTTATTFKKIKVTDADVSKKATFICEVYSK